MQKKFVESDFFPLGVVNDKSFSEKKGGGRPPYWEMVFWWTRKPLIGARAIIAASLLPENTSPDAFKSIVRLNVSTPHRKNPVIPESIKDYFEGVSLLDPFAGFGSIPLEAVRLSLDATAVELLPTAYIFLKAVLVYLEKYGTEKIIITEKKARKSGKSQRLKLIYDVERWGNWVTERLREDEDIKNLYDDDVAVYIGTWEVLCPHCQGWTPVVGNWWLARVKHGDKGYKRLAFMRPVEYVDKVGVEVVDVNAIVGDVSGAVLDGNVIRVGDRAFEVPEPNKYPKKASGRCLLCGNDIESVDESGNVADKGEWYVKWALKKYHEGVDSYARQCLMVKVKVIDNDLLFEPCNEEDNRRLMKAKDKIKAFIEKGDPDIPGELMPWYQLQPPANFPPLLYGFKYWMDLFNPRQLVTLVKLVKLIREVGNRIEKEKIEEVWSEEEAKGYAEAVTTYLGIFLAKFADYNCVVTAAHVSNPRGMDIAHALSTRGITMQWNWCEICPLAVKDYISGIFANSGSIRKVLDGVIRALNFLALSFYSSDIQQKLQPQTGDYTKIKTITILDDATSLSNLNDKTYDIIITDPPYANDVAYTELSDFYYVWLKRALSGSDNKKLFPRFHAGAFFRKTVKDYEEILTQWQEFARQEVSTNPGRFMDRDDRNEFASKHFEALLNLAFLTMKSRLRKGGVLVTYYAHTSSEAWASLLFAGWKGARMRVTNAFPIVTESDQRVTGRGKMRLDTSIVVVWREGVSDAGRINDQSFRLGVVESARNKALSLLKLSKHQDFVLSGRDILIGSMGAVLAELTRYEDVRDARGSISVKDLTERYVFPLTVEGMFNALAEYYGEGVKFANIEDAIGRYYLLLKAFFGATPDSGRFKRLKISPNELVMLKLATGIDASTLVRPKSASSNKTYLFKKEASSGELTFLEPLKFDSRYLSSFLGEKGVVQGERLVINSSVDMFHYLGFLASRGASPRDYEEVRTYNPKAFDEARSIALIFLKVLLEKDPDKIIADMVLGNVFRDV
nr:DUF1156 domain-containing protein [Candidatus Freyarchaeota archaeon]